MYKNLIADFKGINEGKKDTINNVLLSLNFKDLKEVCDQLGENYIYYIENCISRINRQIEELKGEATEKILIYINSKLVNDLIEYKKKVLNFKSIVENKLIDFKGCTFKVMDQYHIEEEYKNLNELMGNIDLELEDGEKSYITVLEDGKKIHEILLKKFSIQIKIKLR